MSPSGYTLMAGDLWRFNFNGRKGSQAPRGSVSHLSDEAILTFLAVHRPPPHQGYSFGKEEKDKLMTNLPRGCYC